MADILIKGALVGTQDANRRVFPDGAVAITGNKIVAVGPTIEIEKAYPAEKVIDASGKIVMPGLICTHTHMPSVVGHNMPVDYSKFRAFMDLLTKWWWPDIEEASTYESIYWCSLWAGAKMLKTGTTTVVDMVEAPSVVDGCLDVSADAVMKLGSRAVICYESTERISKENARAGINENVRFFKKYKDDPESRVSGRMAVHTVYTASEEMLREVRGLATDLGAGIKIHVAEVPPPLVIEKFGRTAPFVLRDTGFLGPDVLAVHCINMNAEEIALWRDHDVKVAHTPMSNMLGGNGVAPIVEMLNEGITVSLGHDCFFTLDLFQYIRMAYLLHKVHHHNPGVIPSFQAIDFATTNAAKAIQKENEIGSLEVGKKADVLIIKPEQPSPLLPQVFYDTLINDVDGANVETVLVDGKVVVDHHKLVNVDEEEIQRKAVEETTKIWKKAGSIQ
jgi:cytosine/adenosine deaminase-related metal-dependent hydrolase